MIPTSLTSSSPPTACLGSIGNQINNSPTISGSAKASNGAGGTVAAAAATAAAVASQGQGNNSAFLGIASLILEGRALADDEYATQTSRYELKTSFGSGTNAECGRQSPKPSTSRAAFGDSHSGGMSSSSFSIDLVNYLGRKSSNSPESTSTSYLRDYYNSSSSESASSSVESNHSRWSQKLSQLRQESPSAHHQAMPARQKVAIECPRGSDAEYVALAINTDHHHPHHQHHFGINEDRKGGDFEILRRMSINQMNFYNSPNSMVGGGGSSGGGVGGGSGSSENFMCSLQSLASNTCLRVGNPLLLTTTSPPRYFNNRQISSSTPRFITPQQQQQQQLDYSNGSASSSCSSGGVGGVSINTWYPSSSSHISKGSSSKNNTSNKDYLLCKSSSSATQRMAIASPQTANTKTINSSTNIFGRSNTSPVTATATATTLSLSTTATASRNQTYPQQGPHCDQFLKKMGLAKSDASDTEEHYCDMSYVNITCTRWRAYCIKMENILARGEPICIEVYLGPVGHKILLEQWIITQREKQPPPTMTLPSLCSAIRSQLYFSQISAWCDLIKKSDKSIHETGRVIYTTPATISAAGDLATTTNNAMITASTTASTTSAHHATVMSPLSTTSPTSVGGNVSGGVVVGVGCGKRRPSSPRLNIFYRIKQYDSTACFNSKPNVHNFPNVNISENCCVSVCLKSLPRITGGIPKVGITATQQQQQQQPQQNISTSGLSPTAMAASPPVNSATPTSLAAKNKIATASAAKATTSDTSNAAAVAVYVAVDANAITTNANKSTILKMNCDNNLKEHQQQQKPFTASSYSSSSPSSSSCSISSSKKTSKQSPIEDNSDCNRCLEPDLQDVDFECYEERNIDMSAGGDNKVILCDSGGGGMVGGSAASVGDCDSSNSSLSTNNFGNLSHREKQLLKYRKRMLKRDKKQQLRLTNENISSSTNRMQNNEIELCNTNNNNNNNKMEQGEDDGDGDAETDVHDDNNDIDGNNSDTAKQSERKYSVNNLEKGQRQQLPNNHKNNSIPCTNQLQLQQQHQYHHVKMISTGTQTITNTCTSCGSEKSMICLKCHPFKVSSDDNALKITTTTTTATSTTTVSDVSYNYEEIMDAETSSVSSLSASDIIHTPRNKAELLLQAIQRTPKSNKKHKHKSKSKDSNQMAAINQQKQKQQQVQQQQQQQNSPTTTATIISSNSSHNDSNSTTGGGNISHNNSNRSRSSNSSTSLSPSSVTNGVIVNNSSSSNSNNSNNMVGCQVCKRQKTQHNFNQSSNEEQLPSDDNNSLANSSLNSSCGSENNSAGKISNQNSSSTDDDKAADDDNDDDNEKDGGKTLSSDCVDNVSFAIDAGYGKKVVEMPSAKTCDNFNESEIMEEEYFESSTKLTPHIDRCSLNVTTCSYYAQLPRSRSAAANNDAAKIQYQSRSCSDQQPLEEKKENSSVTEGTAKMAQFNTPTPSEQNEKGNKNKMQQPLQPHKHTPKPNLLHIACNFNKTNEGQISALIHNNITNNNNNSNNNNNTPTTHNPLLLRRSLPKVNLTPIFCNPNSMMTVVSSSPIPIGNGVVCNGSLNGLTINSADTAIATEAPPTFSFDSPSGSAPSITVQKSNSAPTLPNSPSLSPRFVKASAIYKRRSRHLSERSDRSSLGSDEQFSDEDIDSGMYSPFASSPVKLKTRLAAVFGRKPLLGNLEECLLQRRLVPKIEVMGFKLLLGASGGFCPTQLTIPAAAYFYELKGETLSTPYLCEIRLPRKGYTVPRCGTVQATLLNPMGTVVRMFVIPYDMRDMPTLHQTFIRQRILADTVVQTENEYNQNGVGKEFNDVHQDREATTTVNIKKHQMEQQLQSEKKEHQPTIQQQQQQQQQQRSPQCNNENHQLGHFISTENMKSLRYSIHLRFQTSRTGRLMLHTDIRLLISRRTDCDTAAAHAKGVLEAPNELITNTVMPTNPKYSARQDQTTSKI